jgi:hypothetical protein
MTKLPKNRTLTAVGILAITLSSHGFVNAADDAKSQNKKTAGISYETQAEYSAVAGAQTRIGTINIGEVSEQTSGLKFVQSREIDNGTLLRVGVNWFRYSFGLPDGAMLPNTLQQAAAVFGADIELGDSWLMRVEAEPGIYSDFKDIDFEDFNAPLILGFSYLANADLQWFMGMSVNMRREIPVLPGAGVRWKFADQWTLFLLFPKPKLEYNYNDALTLYVGGEIKGGTYKVSETFGRSHGVAKLDGATLDYTEWRGGLGAEWKFRPGMTLDVDVGAMFSRTFDFHEEETRLKNDEIAPYGQVALKMDF